MAVIDKRKYIADVKRDFAQLKEEYPFSTLSIAPTVDISPASVTVIAANKKLIEHMRAEKDDFLGAYSRKLLVEIPFSYQQDGCKVIGGKWIDENKLNEADRHFNDKKADGSYVFCAGVPESFPKMKNVLLENVRTVENMLIAYEEVQKGFSERTNLKAYAHGKKGKDEYARDRKKYKPRS